MQYKIDKSPETQAEQPHKIITEMLDLALSWVNHADFPGDAKEELEVLSYHC